MFQLPPRLQFIHDNLIPGEPVWDFCCDHGFVGLSAYKSGKFPEIYFVDQVSSIMEKLSRRFDEKFYRVEQNTQVRFLTLPGEEVKDVLKGTVVIAGVGGIAIHKIVKNLHEQSLLKATRLILGPQRDEQKLEEMLCQMLDSDYKICNVDYRIEERGRTRKLLIFNKK